MLEHILLLPETKEACVHVLLITAMLMIICIAHA